MIAEILSVGTELLMGQIANTDAQYISRRLAELGIAIYRHTTVGDNPARVKEALGEALSRSDIVITTGGLGPTEDDLTKEMVAEYFGLEMELHRPSLDAIIARMTATGHPMTENNRKQAFFPVGATILPNAVGTAPGCVVEADGKAVAVLPGPPHELQDMFECQLAPWLARRSGAHIESKFLRVFGIGESSLETQLIDLFHSDNPTLALYCGPGEVQARITAMAPDSAAALLEAIGNGQGVDDCGQHTHMVCTHALHFIAAVFETAPEVAAADHNADLHAGVHAALDHVAHLADHGKVKTPMCVASQSLAADLEQDALVFDLLFCQEKHSFALDYLYSIVFQPN